MSVNLNDLAVTITEKEGKKVNLSIAQVKEVLRLTIIELSNLPISDLRNLFERVVSEK